MTTLTGTQMNALAAALAAAHPDVERMTLDHDTMARIVAALPGAPARALSRGELSVIKWMWMRHADGPGAMAVGDGG
jgi:hypothetical protein